MKLNGKGDKKVSNMTLKDTGDLYKGMYLNINPTDVQMLSKGKNTAGLINRFGLNIFGLTSESLEVVRPVIANDMIVEIKGILAI